MRRLPVPLLVSACLIAPSAVHADLRLASEPAGVHVEIRGPVTVSGITPLPLGDLPSGEYRLLANGPGTATVRGRLWRSGDGGAGAGTEIGLRSVLLPPGTTYFGGGESWRGWLYLTGWGMGIAGTVINESSRRGAVDDMHRAEDLYRRATTEDAILQARLSVESARDKRDDRAEMRNLWGAYLGAVWMGSFLESTVLTGSPTFRPGTDGLIMDVPRAGGPAAAVRSLLVPGAGQRWVGREGRGNLITAGVLALGAGSLAAQSSFLKARRDQADAQRRYDAAKTTEDLDKARSVLESAANRASDRSRTRWILAGATAGIYVWNVLDAWSSGSGVAGGSPVRLSVIPSPGGAEAAVAWRLP